MAWIKGAHRLPAVPSRAADEAQDELRHAARDKQLSLHVDDAARRAGGAYLKLFSKKPPHHLVAAFKTCAEGMRWLADEGAAA